MADTPKSTAPKITRRQTIMIGTLSLALIGTIVFQLGGNQVELAKAGVKAASTAPVKDGTTANVPASKVNWPQVSLDQMLSHNPFAEPAPLVPVKPETPAAVVASPTAAELAASSDAEREAEAEQMAEQKRLNVNAALTALKRDGVKMILRTDRKVSAMIGNRLVHEGDIIDGVRIVSIQTNGVTVEPADVD